MTTITTVGVRALTARDLMSSPAVIVSPGTTIWDAWQRMTSFGLRHLVVCLEDHVVGVIDDRAVFAQWPMGPLALRRTRVADLMRRRVSCLLPDVDARQVANVMILDAVDAVPLVDEDGCVLGVVTGSDLVVAVATHGLSREKEDTQ